jgi:hypothetical protein
LRPPGSRRFRRRSRSVISTLAAEQCRRRSVHRLSANCRATPDSIPRDIAAATR